MCQGYLSVIRLAGDGVCQLPFQGSLPLLRDGTLPPLKGRGTAKLRDGTLPPLKGEGDREAVER